MTPLRTKLQKIQKLNFTEFIHYLICEISAPHYLKFRVRSFKSKDGVIHKAQPTVYQFNPNLKLKRIIETATNSNNKILIEQIITFLVNIPIINYEESNDKEVKNFTIRSADQVQQIVSFLTDVNNLRPEHIKHRRYEWVFDANNNEIAELEGILINLLYIKDAYLDFVHNPKHIDNEEPKNEKKFNKFLLDNNFDLTDTNWAAFIVFSLVCLKCYFIINKVQDTDDMETPRFNLDDINFLEEIDRCINQLYIYIDPSIKKAIQTALKKQGGQESVRVRTKNWVDKLQKKFEDDFYLNEIGLERMKPKNEYNKLKWCNENLEHARNLATQEYELTHPANTEKLTAYSLQKKIHYRE